ncbi:MAG: hypothetical protein R2860_07885 [Desulfobacterales bacterium]
MEIKIKTKKEKMLRLLKPINGVWQIVDYGVPSKAAEYAAMGYLVDQKMTIKETGNGFY